MFRKIHSNRDPGVTVWAELRREFSNYYTAAGKRSKSVLEKKPRLTYSLMVLLMASSFVISFTLFRHRDKPKSKTAIVRSSPVEDGFSQIMRAGQKLKMTLALKNFVDSLSSKNPLTAKDSLKLDSALDRLQSIQKSIN
jgi:hypothetical protein